MSPARWYPESFGWRFLRSHSAQVIDGRVSWLVQPAWCETAQCRFQLTLDLLGGRWLDAKLDAYQRNDRIAASDIVASLVKPGDLIIRDLGYAVISCFEAIEKKGAHFLSRLQRATLFDLHGKKIDLLQLVRAKAPICGNRFTTTVLLGMQNRFRCRLIAIRVPKEVAEQRRRRLHQEGQRQGINHQDSYLVCSRKAN